MQINIPPEHRQRIVNAMKGLYEIPMVKDPESTPEAPLPKVPEFTDDAWAREAFLRVIRRDVRRWEHRQAIEAANAAVESVKDVVN